MLLGCDPPEVAQHRCLGPVVELVKWRNAQNAELLSGRTSPEALSRAEDERVEATEATLRTRERCEEFWRFGLWTTPDTPGAILRDRALRRALDLPPTDYPSLAPP
ncbi:MAG: hypothetical protein FJ090_20230 [Deltaproteobacteria bacterium]|nr:hypothetical protein [Deltaproteobacteria bacterium]